MTDTIEVEKFTTSSGLPMAEYVPQDYPRSDVVYARAGREMALASGSGFCQRKTVVPVPRVEGAYIAGGYAADILFNPSVGDPNDIDVFFKSKEAFEEMFDRLVALGFVVDDQCKRFVDPGTQRLVWDEEFDKLPYVELHPVGLAALFGGRAIQLVKIRWYEDAEHVIDSFDFTAVQAAYDLGAAEFVFNPLGSIHFAKRRIVQHRVESRARVLLRLQKYKDKGFLPTDAFVMPPDPTLISVDMNPVHDTQKVEF